MERHKTQYKLYCLGKYPYVSSFDVMSNNDYQYQILEEVKDRNDLLKRERHYIETSDSVNKNKPSRTVKEYYNDNRDVILLNKKRYYLENRERILTNVKARYHRLKNNAY